MNHKVFFSPEARADVQEIYEYIAERDGLERAAGYLDRVLYGGRSLDRAFARN